MKLKSHENRLDKILMVFVLSLSRFIIIDLVL